MASEHHNLNSTLTARTEFYGPWDNVHIKSVLRGREGVRQILTKGRLHVFGTDNWKGGGPKYRKFMCLICTEIHYRVAHLLTDLGWVDLDLGCSSTLLGQ